MFYCTVQSVEYSSAQWRRRLIFPLHPHPVLTLFTIPTILYVVLYSTVRVQYVELKLK